MCVVFKWWKSRLFSRVYMKDRKFTFFHKGNLMDQTNGMIFLNWLMVCKVKWNGTKKIWNCEEAQNFEHIIFWTEKYEF